MSFLQLLCLFLRGQLCFQLLLADEGQFEFKVAKGGVWSHRFSLGVSERDFEVLEQALDVLSLEEVSVVIKTLLLELIQIAYLHGCALLELRSFDGFQGRCGGYRLKRRGQWNQIVVDETLVEASLTGVVIQLEVIR